MYTSKQRLFFLLQEDGFTKLCAHKESEMKLQVEVGERNETNQIWLSY